MKTPEADELRRIEVQAQEATARSLSRVATALELPQREREEREWQALRTPPKRLFGGERGAVLLLRSIPGFSALWEREVPDGHVRVAQAREGEAWHVVTCMCGEHTALRPGHIGDCPGACGRYFLHVGSSIRVKRFEAA